MTFRESNMKVVSAWRLVLTAAFGLSAAACSGSGATIGASGGPAPGGGATATPTPAGATANPTSSPLPSPTNSPGAISSGLPSLATTSEQTFGLNCSPRLVVTTGGYASCNVLWLEHINLNGGESVGGHFVQSTHTFFV